MLLNILIDNYPSDSDYDSDLVLVGALAEEQVCNQKHSCCPLPPLSDHLVEKQPIFSARVCVHSRLVLLTLA